MASLAMQILSFLSEDNRQVDPRQRDHIERDRRFVGVQQPVVSLKDKAIHAKPVRIRCVGTIDTRAIQCAVCCSTD